LLAGSVAGGEPERAGIVHRLDRDTSGLLVVARSEDVHRRLQQALRRRLIQREYLALVQGTPPARSGTIDAPIGRDAQLRTRTSAWTSARPCPRTSLARCGALKKATKPWRRLSSTVLRPHRPCVNPTLPCLEGALALPVRLAHGDQRRQGSDTWLR